MTVLAELYERRVLVPNESVQVHDPEDRLGQRDWEDIHLAAADINLRRRLSGGKPIELPIEPTARDTVMGLLTSDCGIYCLGGLPSREHVDRRYDVFLFTGDVIKAEPEIPTDPEAFLQALQEQAAHLGHGLEALGVPDGDRALYLGLQPLIWASRAVVNLGPEVVGGGTVQGAIQQLANRFLTGTAVTV